MKKILSFLMITFMILPLSGQEKKVKTGWKFGGALPAISFDTDLGFQYGALAEFYNYGDGSIYPDYLDHIYMQKYPVLQREAAFTGSCTNRTSSSPGFT